MDTNDDDPLATLPFSPDFLPQHIAIIMDGNGRWAKSHAKSRVAGHREGTESVRALVKACRAWHIPYLTLYAFSSENWARPKAEVSALMQLLKRYLRAEVKELDANNVRFRAIGDLARLPAAVRNEVERSTDLLRGNTGLTLTLALSYGARDEILRAAKTLVADVARGVLNPESICEEDFAARLDTVGMPDPDLLIRTAGEQRLSNFLLWQLSYAEFYFSELTWPAFRAEALAEAIRTYQKRLRKFGKTAEQVQHNNT